MVSTAVNHCEHSDFAERGYSYYARAVQTSHHADVRLFGVGKYGQAVADSTNKPGPHSEAAYCE